MMYNSECDMWHGAIHKQFEQGIQDAKMQKCYVAGALAQLKGENIEAAVKKASDDFLKELKQLLDNDIARIKNQSNKKRR